MAPSILRGDFGVESVSDCDMYSFTPEEVETVHSLWRELPNEHVWSGWGAVGAEPETIWIFRTRANWRRFLLVKVDGGFNLQDEKSRVVASGPSLKDLLSAVEAIPGLNNDYK